MSAHAPWRGRRTAWGTPANPYAPLDGDNARGPCFRVVVWSRPLTETAEATLHRLWEGSASERMDGSADDSVPETVPFQVLLSGLPASLSTQRCFPSHTGALMQLILNKGARSGPHMSPLSGRQL